MLENACRFTHNLLARARFFALGASCALATMGHAALAADGCADIGVDASKLGVGRVVEIDTTRGPMLGKMTALRREDTFLAPFEVVLTFDDGPMPWITRSILSTLAQHCTRATFFSVGKMALAYPSVLRAELDQGHTVGTHTWSHPLNLKRLAPDAALGEIERGFAAVAAAAGRPIAPFFRFPGLSDSPSMVAHLATRHVASFTVDVVSNDSFISDPVRLTQETLAKVDANQGGIILFHDIKATTAKALPDILSGLAARGYSVVHIVPKAPMQPQRDLMASYEPQVARTVAEKINGQRAPLMPFFGSVGPEKVARTPTGSISRDVPEPLVTLRGTDAMREDTLQEETAMDFENEAFDDAAPASGRVRRTDAGWSTTVRRNRGN